MSRNYPLQLVMSCMPCSLFGTSRVHSAEIKDGRSGVVKFLNCKVEAESCWYPVLGKSSPGDLEGHTKCKRTGNYTVKVSTGGSQELD